MRLLTTRLIVSLVFSIGAILANATTIVATKTGSWANPDTWNGKPIPKRTDSIIIPQGITVSVIGPVMMGLSEDGKPLSITIAGVLNLASGSLHIDPIDRVIIVPGGKVSTKSFGGMIFAGIYALHLEGGTMARGPATLGDGYSPTSISAITAEKEVDGITLSWRSCSEIEVNYYFVSRSVDGVNFAQLGKVDGRGSRKEKVYEFIDKSHSTGVVYYRIDLTNMNGVGATVATANMIIGNVEGTFTPEATNTAGHK